MIFYDKEQAISHFKLLLGNKNVLTQNDEQFPYLKEWRDKYFGKALAVLFPQNTQQVSEIVKYCSQHKIAIVPQGGNTGLVGGQIPDNTGEQIVLNLSKMNHIRHLDKIGQTILVDSGVILEELHHIVEEHDLYFPLSLASQGSTQIGGLISTNAGGTAVLRYGNMRSFVLGLEVVLADGSIISHLSPLFKDNTGYDLKQLFIGAEGTLGIITAACLKLYTKPKSKITAMLGFNDLQAVIECFCTLKHILGDILTSFELIPQIGIEFVTKHGENLNNPFSQNFNWQVLFEVESMLPESYLNEFATEQLSTLLEQNIAQDIVIAQNQTQAKLMWKLREFMSESQKYEGGSIKHDISVPIASIADFIHSTINLVETYMPHIRPVPFGHIGDGNIHFNLSQPIEMDKQDFLDQWNAISRIVHDNVAKFHGSISAEHGLGQMKIDEITLYKSQAELNLMRQIKKSLDPYNIFNPQKLIRV